MAVNDFELKRCGKELEKFMAAKRPHAHIRHQLDLGYRLQDQSVEIFEIRPHSRQPQQMIEIPAAKTTYVKNDNLWKVYWQRSDLKWHRYEFAPSVKSIEEFLSLVDEDRHGCFFG